LDGSYDQTIRAGNTNPETIRVAIGSLKGSDNAKIEAHAVERATQGTVAADGTSTALNVKEATKTVVDTSVFSTAFKTIYKEDSLGEFKLVAAAADSDHALYDINSRTGEVTSKAAQDFETKLDAFTAPAVAGDNVYNFKVEYWKRGAVAASHTEVIALTITDKAQTELDDIKVETQADATRAVETLDKALEEVSTAQAKLGAIQNRLSHNIDNLSKGSMLTEQSVGRIVDADFATETSELSKQQILAQAATSMLAQANQSKQSVLALLQ